MRLLLTALLAVLLVGGTSTVAGAVPLDRSDHTEFRLGRLYVDGKGRASSTISGSGGSVRLTPSTSWTYWGSKVVPPRIGLQRYAGGRWRDLRAASVTIPKNLSTGSIVVRTRAHRAASAAETVRYRLISRPYSSAAGSVTNTSASKPFRVRYEDQSRYTGVRRVAWQAVRPYCPATAVTVGDPGDGYAGDYQPGELRIRLAPASTGWEDRIVRSVALHECAHERQWLNYGATSKGDDRMSKAAAAVYVDDTAPEGTTTSYPLEPSEQPFDPTEHGADCASIAIAPDGYLGYGGWCDPDELAAGVRLMQGGRY